MQAIFRCIWYPPTPTHTHFLLKLPLKILLEKNKKTGRWREKGEMIEKDLGQKRMQATMVSSLPLVHVMHALPGELQII